MAGSWLIPYLSKIRFLFVAVMLINVFSVWFRARVTSRKGAFYVVCAGILAIILGKTVFVSGEVAALGIALTFSGSLWSAVEGKDLPFISWFAMVRRRFHSVRNEY